LGVFFMGTSTGAYPWDLSTAPVNLEDGASSTLMAGENMLVGVSSGTTASGGMATNWACPMPHFCMFFASDSVCAVGTTPNVCDQAPLTSFGGAVDGPGWANANRDGSRANINYGTNLTVEGTFPYLLSNHSSGVNTVFCDGSARLLKSTINGSVYAKLITPAG